MSKEPLLTGHKFMRIHPVKTCGELLVETVAVYWVLLVEESRGQAGEGAAFCWWLGFPGGNGTSQQNRKSPSGEALTSMK